METLGDLLNKTEAMIDCRAGTVNELAKFLGRRPQRVSEWIGQRKYCPPGDVTLKIQEWAAKISNRIAVTKRLQPIYRESYAKICERRSRPGNGKN
jgi:hypothetical protein